MSGQEQISVKPDQTAGDSGRKRRWIKWLIEVVIIIVIIAGVRVWQQRHMVSGPAPALQGALLSGKVFVLPSNPPRPVMVHFWGSWCPICRAEQESVNSISDDHDVISIALSSGNTQEIGKFVVDQKIRFPVINDPDGSISAQWGVSAVPASFIIDTDGNIRFREVGYTTGWGMKLRLWLAGL